MFESSLMIVLIIVALMLVSVSVTLIWSIKDKIRSERNGKLEIKFTEINDGDETNTVKYVTLILETKYRLINGARWNKEEVAVLINNLVERKCALKGFRIRDNIKKTLKEIKDIIERIKPLLPREADSELIAIEYRISEKTIPNLKKDINLNLN